jgi:phosphonoacetaldehyde hydrolase
MGMTPQLPIRGVILDWAGTTVDYGSLAPARVFVEIFRQRGIEITVAEARGPMGRSKPDHIWEILTLPRVSAIWQTRNGRAPVASDVQALYTDFLPLQKATLQQKSDVIPGVPEAIRKLRAQGLKIGSSTGYTRELMEIVAPIAALRGYAPDVVVCADDVPAGRPAPWMNFLNAQRLDIYPMSSVVVVDDTPIGVQAAINSGAIAVAVSQTGNALGLAAEEAAQLPPDEMTRRLQAIEDQFRSCGAHSVIRSVAELPELIASFEAGTLRR